MSLTQSTRQWLLLLGTGVAGIVSMPALGQTVTATVNINTSVTTPVAPNFSGINDGFRFPIEYWDYRLNTLAATLNFGWVALPRRHRE